MSMSSSANTREVMVPAVEHDHHCHHHHKSGLSWAAIIGGVFLSMAISIVLFMLGSALELSTVSPWSPDSGSVGSFSVKLVIWLIVVQWISAGMGGYLAGRLRCKWHGLHIHEVFFRDTAHGLVTWAVATVLMAALFASSGAAVVGGGIKALTTVATGAGMGAAQGTSSEPSEPSGYYIDSLLRPTAPNASEPLQDQRMEVTRILAKDLKDGNVPDTDKAYLADIVSARSGLNQADAQKRVNDTIDQINTAKEKAKETAEAARKSALKISIYMVLSLLIGAFVASAAAAFGGSQRDEY